MTDPRIKAGARALCVLGGGHTTEGTYPNCDHVAQHEEGARVALAAADAVDPVRKAARKVCIDSGDLTLGQAIDALGVALAAK